ncbi:MAG: hypothetical protein JWQ63_2167 [Mucilaginibacter sp.]|nr:hypothetical protein [Mucilaginibacter sp.]
MQIEVKYSQTDALLQLEAGTPSIKRTFVNTHKS